MTRVPCNTFLKPEPAHSRVSPVADLSVNDGLRAAALAGSLLALVNAYPGHIGVAALKMAMERMETR